MGMTYEELGQKVKAKYPEYQNVPDGELGQRVAEKYPEYQAYISQKPGYFKRIGQAFTQGAKEAEQATTQLRQEIGKGKKGVVRGTAEGVLTFANQAFLPFARAAGAITAPVVNPVVNTAANIGQKGLEIASAPLQYGIKKALGDKNLAAIQQKTGNYLNNLSPETKSTAGNIMRGLESAGYVAGIVPAAQTARLAPSLIKNTAKLGAEKGGIVKALKNSAAKNYERILNPTKETNKRTTQFLTGQMVENADQLPSGFTTIRRKDLLNKVTEGKKAVGEQMNVFEEAGRIKGSTKTEQLLKSLTDKQYKLVVKVNENKPPASAVTAKSLDDFLSNPDLPALTEEGGKNILRTEDGTFAILDPKEFQTIENYKGLIREFGDVIPNDKMRKVRQAFDQVISRKKKGEYMKTVQEGSELDVQKDLADVMRDEIAKANPDLDKLNKQYKFYKDMEKVLSDTVKRKTGQSDIVSGGGSAMLGGVLGIPSGVVSGGVGIAAAFGLYKLMTSTGWRLVSGSLKARLAKAIASGDRAALKEIVQQIKKQIPAGTAAAGSQQINPQSNS